MTAPAGPPDVAGAAGVERVAPVAQLVPRGRGEGVGWGEGAAAPGDGQPRVPAERADVQVRKGGGWGE